MLKKIPILKPSTIDKDGIGVFTQYDLKKGEKVNIWDGKDCKFVRLKKKKLLCLERPDLEFFFDTYCVETSSGYYCPLDFIRMSVGWYINHSDNPNVASHDFGDTYYAARDINSGEELTLDYSKLDPVVDNSLENLE